MASRNIRAGAVAWLGWPLTRETEGQKNIRTEDLTFVLAAYRGNIRNISYIRDI